MKSHDDVPCATLSRAYLADLVSLPKVEEVQNVQLTFVLREGVVIHPTCPRRIVGQAAMWGEAAGAEQLVDQSLSTAWHLKSKTP